MESNGKASPTYPFDKCVEAVEAGLRRQLDLLTVVHRAKKAAHLGERRAARVLNV
jgi:hypothetical protein